MDINNLTLDEVIRTYANHDDALVRKLVRFVELALDEQEQILDETAGYIKWLEDAVDDLEAKLAHQQDDAAFTVTSFDAIGNKTPLKQQIRTN